MLAPSHPSWDPRVVHREAASLVKLGHTVAVVAMHDPSRPAPENILLLSLPQVQLTRWRRFKRLWMTYGLGRSWPADVYHAHEVESLLIGILLKWRTGAKLVFDAHECFHFTAARFSKGRMAKVITWLTARGLRWMSRRANHVIVVSFTNEQFYRDYCGCKKVTIIHNSPPILGVPYKDKPEEARWTLTHDGFLDCGRGMLQMLEALALVRREMPARLLVVGQVHQHELPLFSRRIQELGIQDAITVTGWVPYAEVTALLNRGSIGLVAMQPTPNNYGSLSNKLFNYMATGQAVIGPKGSDTEVVLQRAHCGVVAEMTNAELLAKAMLELLSNPERTKTLGLNGRRAVEDEYGWHKMEQLLEEIYAGLGGGGEKRVLKPGQG